MVMPRIAVPLVIGIVTLAAAFGLVTFGMNLAHYRQMVIPACSAGASQYNDEIVAALANRTLGESQHVAAQTTCQRRQSGTGFVYECVDYPTISEHYAVVQLDTRDCSTLIAISRSENIGRFSPP